MSLTSFCELLFEAPDYAGMYRKIISNINDSNAPPEANGKPSDEWISGILASRGSTDGRTAKLLSKLHNDELDQDSKEYRDAVRTDIAFKTLAAYGFITRAENGRFAFPQDAARRDYLAGFRKYLSMEFNQNKEDSDIGKMMKNALSSESKAWADSLSPENRQLLNIYSGMDKSTFTFLKGLIAERKNLAEFRKRINSAKFSSNDAYTTLKELRLLNDNDTLDMSLIKRFSSFLKDPDGSGMPNAYARLKPFERSADYQVSRATADQALRRNALDKRLDTQSPQASESDKYVQDIMSDLTPSEIKDIVALYKGDKSGNMANLRALGIIDNGGEFTPVGKAVSASLNVNPDIDTFNSNPILKSRLHGIKGDRRAERTVDRTTNFKQYANLDA